MSPEHNLAQNQKCLSDQWNRNEISETDSQVNEQLFLDKVARSMKESKEKNCNIYGVEKIGKSRVKNIQNKILNTTPYLTIYTKFISKWINNHGTRLES